MPNITFWLSKIWFSSFSMTDKIQKYFDLMKDVEENLLVYIGESNQDYNIINYLDKHEITQNKPQLKSFLYLLVHISNNYHPTGNFYNKIFSILSNFKCLIQKHFQNAEIFHIFQSSKRLLLFLIQQNLIKINQEIFDFFNQTNFHQKSYIEYFFPEIESFIQESLKKEYKSKVKELNENNLILFNEKRKIGENDSYICSLIRNDQVVDFITYLEKTNTSPSSDIKISIYETNQFLLNNAKRTSLIEYSAYFGAQQIFAYLCKRNVKMESNIWSYAIHGKNADLIHLLEENHVETFGNSFQYLVVEAIKCHHNEIADYFLLNFCQEEQIYEQYLLKKCLKYHNFNIKDYDVEQIIQYSVESDLFYSLCKYDYSFVVEEILSTTKINVNRQYQIYKPLENQEDIVLSIAIKNGDIDKIPEEKRYRWFIGDIEELEKDEYKEGKNYYAYNYNLEVMTALSIAARKGNIDIIRLLLHSEKIDFGIKSRKYYKFEYNSCVEYMTVLEKRSLLHDAIECGYIDSVQTVLSLNKVNANDDLIHLETFRDSSTAQIIINNENHKTTLELAAELGYCEIMKFLISQKIDIDRKSIEIDIEAGGCIGYLTKVTRIEKTPLYAAIQNGHYNIVKTCLKHPKIDINCPFVAMKLKGLRWKTFSSYFYDESGEVYLQISALYLSVINGNIDIVRLLLNQPKIDINMRSTLVQKSFNDTTLLRTALHEAVENKRIEIIKLLLQQKEINKNVLDEKNEKPIDYTNDEKIKELFNSKC